VILFLSFLCGLFASTTALCDLLVAHSHALASAATREQYGPDWMLNATAMAGFDYLEKCYHESIRIAQQSLTLRLVLKPVHMLCCFVACGLSSLRLLCTHVLVCDVFPVHTKCSLKNSKLGGD
jgi:hypothetical protein